MLANALMSVCLLLTFQNFCNMEIINESSLGNLDKLTNDSASSSSSNGSTDVTISPAIRDIGDVGVTTGIKF